VASVAAVKFAAAYAAHRGSPWLEWLAVPTDDLGLRVTERPGWLIVSFDEPVRACSWAIVGGGIVETRHVAWLEVRNADLGLDVDPRELLASRMHGAGIELAVGLLTSHRVAAYHDARAASRGVTARCLATVGLSNALRAGDPVATAPPVGTINLLAYVDAALTDEALIEAVAIATEAKCAAVLEAGTRSRQSGRPATGTGTDCVVVACPRGAEQDPTGRQGNARGARERGTYAGKHTPVGSALGAAVERAIAEGVRQWREDVGL
jgi:adenosylcobinamide amidohydrolase